MSRHFDQYEIVIRILVKPISEQLTTSGVY